ncbi:hypothetical protein [Empedobacter tilapiae]|uniref:Uncharacterized protein n=1 Tax=Empedobacter tilapiae TaxID=2491114 RepID=A0A4Z1BJV9_9FLAO|nr:hypothetical protein [Empedobacter tilapiae]TGN24232.1 hypothetical protein E4J94_13360 [Empedobacter tilapiae]
MKKIIFLISVCTLSTATAQVLIGDNQINEDQSTILYFSNTSSNTNGIILPAIENVTNALAESTINNNGTFLFDKSDKKVKMYEKNLWVTLSGSGNTSQIINNNSEELGNGVIIGAQTTNAKGVLVLESDSKAMVLPKIANPHTTVKSPYPGMICYDTVSKTLAVFDGNHWSYWK